MSTLTDRITEVLRQHKPFPGGTFANSCVSKVCRCPHCGWEGDNPDAHIAELVAELFTMQRRQFDSYGHENPETRWVSTWSAVEEKP